MGVILWNIFKIIGFLLLAILALLLLVVILVLFSPICYYVAGNDTEGMNGSFDVKWILGTIHAYGIYEKGKLEFSLKLFGYCIYGADKKQKQKKDMISIRRKQEAPQTKEQEQPKQEQVEQEQVEQEKVEQEKIEQQEPKKQQEKQTIKKEPKKQKNKKKKKQKQKKVKKPRKKIDEKYKQLITYIFQHKKELLHGTFVFCKRMLKGILPKDICLKATIGTSDPALTGYLLGVAGVAKMKFKNLQITGDFTQKIIKDVFLKVKGRILLGYLFYAVIRLLLIKSVRKSIMIVWKGYGDNNG